MVLFGCIHLNPSVHSLYRYRRWCEVTLTDDEGGIRLHPWGFGTGGKALEENHSKEKTCRKLDDSVWSCRWSLKNGKTLLRESTLSWRRRTPWILQSGVSAWGTSISPFRVPMDCTRSLISRFPKNKSIIWSISIWRMIFWAVCRNRKCTIIRKRKNRCHLLLVCYRWVNLFVVNGVQCAAHLENARGEATHSLFL